MDFVESEYNHCVYIKEVTKDTYIYLLLYVDDMFVASRDATEISKVKKLLNSRFEMKDLGPARQILGKDIERDSGKGILTLSQSDLSRRFSGYSTWMSQRVCQHLLVHISNCLP